MSDKRRVQNANPMEYDGIKFKSLLEVMTYKTLVQAGFKPEYETHPYLIWEGFIPTVPFYTKNTLKRKDRRCTPLSRSTMIVHKPLNGVVYIPDFYFEHGGKKIIVEVKGFKTQLFDMKFKMFRRHIEEQPDKGAYIIWEIHTKKQLLECINHLLQLLSQ